MHINPALHPSTKVNLKEEEQRQELIMGSPSPLMRRRGQSVHALESPVAARLSLSRSENSFDLRQKLNTENIISAASMRTPSVEKVSPHTPQDGTFPVDTNILSISAEKRLFPSFGGASSHRSFLQLHLPGSEENTSPALLLGLECRNQGSSITMLTLH